MLRTLDELIGVDLNDNSLQVKYFFFLFVMLV